MKKLPISICILSWNNVKTLENTLRSYKKLGLLDLSEDIVILFQEASEQDQKLADKYRVKTILLKENIGIGAGIKLLAENAKFENVLFLENDWELIENKRTVISQLQNGLKLLDKNYDVIRYRSRKKPGHPLHSLKHKGNELHYFDDWHNCTSPHLLESLHWLDPAAEFPDKIQKDDNFFITTSRWANWTNNPFLVKKDFLLDKILSFAGESLSFERNIAEWWTKQNFKIAQGEGMFTHNDLAKYPKNVFLKKIIRKLKEKLK